MHATVYCREHFDLLKNYEIRKAEKDVGELLKGR
jgi:hypothetical protein